MNVAGSAGVAAADDLPARGTRLPRSARRTQLLGAAQEVFVAQGYHAAAMDDIAERAGVSKPVLYQHFPGKLELYLALLDAAAPRRSSRPCATRSPSTDRQQAAGRGDASQAYFDFVDRPRRRVPAGLRVRPDATSRRCASGSSGSLQECAEPSAPSIAEDAGLSAGAGPAARRRADRHGPGRRALLGHDRRGRPQGRARSQLLVDARLARHLAASRARRATDAERTRAASSLGPGSGARPGVRAAGVTHEQEVSGGGQDRRASTPPASSSIESDQTPDE